jgi:hypothetical protein
MNGSSVMNSTSGRIRGSFNRTQKAVGTTRAVLTITVATPMTKEYRSVAPNSGSSRIPV